MRASSAAGSTAASKAPPRWAITKPSCPASKAGPASPATTRSSSTSATPTPRGFSWSDGTRLFPLHPTGVEREEKTNLRCDLRSFGERFLDDAHDMGALGPVQRQPGATQSLAAVAHHRLGKLDVLHQLDRDVEMQHRHEPAVERQRFGKFSRLG